MLALVGALVLTSTLSTGLLTLALVVEAVVVVVEEVVMVVGKVEMVVGKVEMEEEEGKSSPVKVPMGNQYQQDRGTWRDLFKQRWEEGFLQQQRQASSKPPYLEPQ